MSRAARQRIAQINGVGGEVITEAFTKKHYIAIAKIISKHNSGGQLSELVTALADMFAADNSNFDRARFIDACDIQ